MKRLAIWGVSGLVIVFAVVYALNKNKSTPSGSDAAAAASKVRMASAAGALYSPNPAELQQVVDICIVSARPERLGKIRGLIVPSNGYLSSGPVAGSAYRQLYQKGVERAFILGQSRFSQFKGAYITGSEAFQTPLGQIQVDPIAREMAKTAPFTGSTECKVNRPPWANLVPVATPGGQDLPDTWEYAIEVQLPFLQRIATAKIVPILYGPDSNDVDTAKVAEALAKNMDDKSIVIVSSDLSNSMPYSEARQVDGAFLARITDLDVAGMNRVKDIELASAKQAIITLVQLAKLKGWKAKVLDYRNSLDTTGQPTQQGTVVGYAAVAFYDPNTPDTSPEPTPPTPASAPAKLLASSVDESPKFNIDERKILMEIARKAIAEAVISGRFATVDDSQIPAHLKETRGCFVAITQQGMVRGMSGNIVPEKPLYQAVLEYAARAGDPRVSNMTANDLGAISIEISVVSPPRKVDYNNADELLGKLRPKTDGVMFRNPPYQAAFLPQEWNRQPDKAKFMDELVKQAGLPEWIWRNKNSTIETFQVETFGDRD